MRTLTTKQVATLLGVSNQTIRNMIVAGDLPGVRLSPTRWYRVKAADLETFAAARGLSLDWSLIGLPHKQPIGQN